MVVDDLRGGILGSSLFAGCNNDDPVTPDAQPEIVFAKESLDVPAEGGPFQIEYTIENPVANATLSAKCNDSWITDIDTKTAGVISFNVTKTKQRKREKQSSKFRTRISSRRLPLQQNRRPVRRRHLR